jgi:hypothetical protein
MGIDLVRDRGVWDAFIDRSPFGQIFHKWDFLRIIEKHTRCQLLPYALYNGEQLVGVVPLFLKKSYGARFIMSPPPMTGIPYQGLVMDGSFDRLKQHKKEQMLGSLSDHLIEEVEAYRPTMVVVSNPPDFHDLRQFRWKGYDLDPTYTYRVDLNRPLPDIWNGFSKARRQSIKSAAHSGLSMIKGGDISSLYTMLEERYLEQGYASPVISRDYLKDVCDAYPENVILYTVQDGETMSGSVLITRYKDVKVWMGTTRSSNHSNEFLIWNVLQEAKNEGYDSCEFIGANTRNLCAFKSQFNPSLAMYFRITKQNALGRLSEMLYRTFYRRIRKV